MQLPYFHYIARLVWMMHYVLLLPRLALVNHTPLPLHTGERNELVENQEVRQD